MQGRTTLVIAHRLSTDRACRPDRRHARGRSRRNRQPRRARRARRLLRLVAPHAVRELRLHVAVAQVVRLGRAQCHLVRQEPAALGACGRSRRSISRSRGCGARLTRAAGAEGGRIAGARDRRRQRQRRRHGQDAVRDLARGAVEAARPQSRHRHARLSRQRHGVAARGGARRRSAWRSATSPCCSRAAPAAPWSAGPTASRASQRCCRDSARRRRAVGRRLAALPARAVVRDRRRRRRARHGQRACACPRGRCASRCRGCNEVDAIVVNGGDWGHAGVFRASAVVTKVYHLKDGATRTLDSFKAHEPVHAVAGIGNPQRFFDLLRRRGARRRCRTRSRIMPRSGPSSSRSTSPAPC